MGVRALLADTTPLSTPAFRRLWSANIITVVGAQLTVVAVPAQIYAITRSSAYVGLTGVFGLVPLVVFGLWGGALADVLDRRSILRVTTIGLIGTSGVFWAQASIVEHSAERAATRKGFMRLLPAVMSCSGTTAGSCGPTTSLARRVMSDLTLSAIQVLD